MIRRIGLTGEQRPQAGNLRFGRIGAPCFRLRPLSFLFHSLGFHFQEFLGRG